MQRHKESVDKKIAEATEERGLIVLLTGDGKGKSSSAFGMVMRSLGYGHQVGVVQFIKGKQQSGEAMFLRDHCPQVKLVQMGTGFTWNTQDREQDIAAAEATWSEAEAMLRNESMRLVVLDEITYMLSYDYLDRAKVLDTIAMRPPEQSVIVTGRGGGSEIRELADTVSEVKDIKHAFKNGVKAREGVDF